MDSFQHKQQLRKEGKVEIPLMIDPSRYFIGNIRVKDVVYSLPALILSLLIIYLLYKTGNLNSSLFVFSFLPFLLIFTFFWVKHPERKNVPFISTLWWRIKFAQDKKLYEFTRKVEGNMSEDIRSQLGVYNISNDCLETLDNRLCKVLEVPSINIDGLSDRERDRVLKDYQTFLQELPIDIFPFQSHQFSQPINLSSYLEWVRNSVSEERNVYKRLLAESYINKGNDIQKAKNMVNKARYIIVSVKVGTSKDKAIEKVSLKAEQMRSSLENSFSRKYEIDPIVLNNDQLFQYVYACIDYENAQIRQDSKGKDINLPYSIPRNKFEKITEDGKIREIS